MIILNNKFLLTKKTFLKLLTVYNIISPSACEPNKFFVCSIIEFINQRMKKESAYEFIY
jgi:hypothetical protein